MFDWMRKIPHPRYGKFCGLRNDGSAFGSNEPIDKLDEACYYHDMACFKAEQIEDKKERKKHKSKADHEFALALRSNLAPYFHKVYGPIYKKLASLVFRP